MTPRRIARLGAAPVLAPILAIALSGCVSVFPKSEPSQLYSFGNRIDAQPAPAAPHNPGARGILLGAITFPRAATGDNLLSVTGTERAYIAAARWVAPAQVLFREAIERSFDRTARATRLINRGEAARIDMTLRIDVHDFVVLYPNGPETIPTVAVSMQARLTGNGGQLLDERDFDYRQPATENRVSAIVDAFDTATAKAMGDVVAWSDQTAAALPPVPAAVNATTTTVRPAR
ncbi:MAG: hypothetical protein B7Y99_12495 [Caulobacterales bacterium 32-69-10]|nr:MAG: hypothetical protein B7Y99_12495 [Caulobacterales bacterium 32-69-10]